VLKSNWFIFSTFVVVHFFIVLYSQNYLLTENLYRLLAGSQMSDTQFQEYMNFVHRVQWISYFFIPLVLVLRISFTWVCLKSGSFIADSFTEASFLKIAIQAEIVFAVGAVAGLLYTELFVNVETLEQLSVNPFSLQVFTASTMPKWSSYFFNTLNIFEIGYVFVLAYLIAEEAKSKVLPSLKFVASTYLPGLALWVLLVSYLSVVFQP
jgi:hypothetical protein